MHRTADQLAAGLDDILRSPRDAGTVALIVTRPSAGERVIHDQVTISAIGVAGDNWHTRPTKTGEPPVPARAVTLMNIRVIKLIADEPERPLAGDQLFIDLDLSVANLPAGTRLRIGTALLEVSELPHTGCAKFSERFGSEALRWVNTPEGRALNLRGINAGVVEPGVVRRGEVVRVLR